MNNCSDFIIKNGVLKKYVGSDRTVIIPDSVKEIGKEAFSILDAVREDPLSHEEVRFYKDNDLLESVEIPEGVVVIGESAFEKCTSLHHIVLPHSLETIGRFAFADSGIVEIVIPEGVKLIEKGAFFGTEMNKIEIKGNTKVQSPAFPDNLQAYLEGKCNQIYELPEEMPLFPLLFAYGEMSDSDPDRGYEGQKGEVFRSLLNHPENFRKADRIFLGGHALKNSKLIHALFKSITVTELQCFISLGLVTAENADLLLDYLAEKPEERAILIKYISEHVTDSAREKVADEIQEKEHAKRTKQNSVIEKTLKVFSAKKAADIKKEWQTTENEDGSLSIEKYKGKDEMFVIPAEIVKKRVLSIGDDALRASADKDPITGASMNKNAYQKKMYKNKVVVISDGIKSIGARAFQGCIYLTDILIPQSVTMIGADAFLDCHKVTIHAPLGSCAEQYAGEYSLRFEAE